MVLSDSILVADLHIQIISADEANKAVTRLPDVLTDPEWGHSKLAEHTAFNKSSGFPESFFKWYVSTFEESSDAITIRPLLEFLGYTRGCDPRCKVWCWPHRMGKCS